VEFTQFAAMTVTLVEFPEHVDGASLGCSWQCTTLLVAPMGSLGGQNVRFLLYAGRWDDGDRVA
jgi:hypothetical protein